MTAAAQAQGRALTGGRVGSLVERAAFGALLLLGAGFAVELRRPLIDVGGRFALTNVEALYGTVIALWIAARIMQKRRLALPSQAILPAGVWLGWLALSTLAAPDYRMQAALFMGRVIGGVLVGAAAFDLADTADRRRALIASLAVGGGVVALAGLAEATGHPGVLRVLAGFKAAQTRVGEVVRVSGTLSYATIASMVLELTIPLMLAICLSVEDRRRRTLFAAGIALSLAALVLTLSRAGIIALGAALAIFGWYGWRARQRGVVIGAASAGLALIVLVGAVMLWNPTVALRLSTETEQAWYRAEYTAPESAVARPGDVITLPVRVTNTSVRRWEAEGSQPFALSYHLLDEQGEPITYDGLRTALPHDVEPGESVTLEGVAAIPLERGDYVIEWDMVQEAVSWFSWKDTPVASTRLAVSGAPVDAADLTITAPPTDIRITQPTAVRSDLWRAALLMALDRPLLGVGPDNFRWQYGHYAGLDAWNTDIHANNLYLEWLADTGMVGLAAFVWLSAVIVRGAYRGVNRDDLLAVGLLASLIAWYVHGVFDTFYEFTPTYAAFWLIAGLALRSGQQAGE